MKGKTAPAAPIDHGDFLTIRNRFRRLEGIGLIREGAEYDLINSLRTLLHLSPGELSTALGISRRTLAHRQQQGKFNTSRSDLKRPMIPS